MMMWRRGLSNTELYTMGGLPGAGLGGQWRRGSIIASPRRTAVLRTRQAEGEYSRRNDTMYTMYIMVK